MENWWVNIWRGWGFIKNWDVVQPLGWAGLESWKFPPEEEENKELEQMLGNEMKQAQKDCCGRSEIAEETKPKDGVRKRVEKGMGWERKEK